MGYESRDDLQLLNQLVKVLNNYLISHKKKVADNKKDRKDLIHKIAKHIYDYCGIETDCLHIFINSSYLPDIFKFGIRYESTYSTDKFGALLCALFNLCDNMKTNLIGRSQFKKDLFEVLKNYEKKEVNGISEGDVIGVMHYIESHPANIFVLPRDLLNYIVYMLDYVSVVKLSVVSKVFHEIANQESLWKNQYRKELGIEEKFFKAFETSEDYPSLERPYFHFFQKEKHEQKSYLVCPTRKKEPEAHDPIALLNEIKDSPWVFLQNMRIFPTLEAAIDDKFSYRHIAYFCELNLPFDKLIKLLGALDQRAKIFAHITKIYPDSLTAKIMQTQNPNNPFIPYAKVKFVDGRLELVEGKSLLTLRSG